VFGGADVPDRNAYEEKVVKRIGVWSYAKIATIIMAIFGLINGIYMAIVISLLGTRASAAVDPLTLSLGAFVIIIFPIIFAIMGFVGGIIGAWLYNMIAKWVGGVKIEFEK